MRATHDAFFNGGFYLWQPERGYRANIDSLLLAQFAPKMPHETVVDYGTGCGIIALTLLWKKKAARAIGVEVSDELAQLAVRNATDLDQPLEVVRADWRFWSKTMPSMAKLVVCNPPYRALLSGAISPDQQRAQARHEVAGGLADLVDAVATVLVSSGSWCLVYPVDRVDELHRHAAARGLAISRRRDVCSTAGEQPRMALIEYCKSGDIHSVEPTVREAPLVVFAGEADDVGRRRYHPTVAEWLGRGSGG